MLDILSDAGLLWCRPMDTPMQTNAKLLPYQGEDLDNPSRYRRLVEKLNYLTVTRPDITFAINVVIFQHRRQVIRMQWYEYSET